MQAQAACRRRKSSTDLSDHPIKPANQPTAIEVVPPGRLLAIDLGEKRVGIAITDELRITVTPLERLERRSWKDLLRRVAALVGSYDARALVIGLPLNMDGTQGAAAAEALRKAENFRKSLNVPVFVQDERLTSLTAESEMNNHGLAQDEIQRRVDSESAAIILRDFLATRGQGGLS
jgi:putative holliday junction resolvase